MNNRGKKSNLLLILSRENFERGSQIPAMEQPRRAMGMKMNDRIDTLAQTVWDYHVLNHTLKKSDVIIVLCSHDPRVAERGAELYKEGLAPIIVFSGGVGELTEGMYGGHTAFAGWAGSSEALLLVPIRTGLRSPAWRGASVCLLSCSGGWGKWKGMLREGKVHRRRCWTGFGGTFTLLLRRPC